MKKKYQFGGGLHKGYPKPEQRPVIKQGIKGAPTQKSVFEGKRLEERQNFEKRVTRAKAGLAAASASGIPFYAESAQALGIGLDLGTGIKKKNTGKEGASKDFLQAGVGTAALLNPAKRAKTYFKGVQKGVSFLKAAELANDANDIVDGASTYKRGGKMPQKKLSYEEWKKKYNKRETSDYKLREAYDLGYTPDNKGHLPTVNDKTGEFLKSSKHPTVREELNWYKSKDGASYRDKHDLDSSGEYWKYVPKLKEGGKFPYKPPKKPASGKVEYVPLVESVVGGIGGQGAKLGAKSISSTLDKAVGGWVGEVLNSAYKHKGEGREGLKKAREEIFGFKKGGKMPLKKASGKGKAAVQKAVSANIQELTRANREKPASKKRSKEQIAAIAYSAARKK